MYTEQGDSEDKSCNIMLPVCIGSSGYLVRNKTTHVMHRCSMGIVELCSCKSTPCKSHTDMIMYVKEYLSSPSENVYKPIPTSYKTLTKPIQSSSFHLPSPQTSKPFAQPARDVSASSIASPDIPFPLAVVLGVICG